MRIATRAPEVFTAVYDLFARAYLGQLGNRPAEGLPGLESLLGALGDLDARWPEALESLVPGSGARGTGGACGVAPVPGRYVPPYASVHLDGGSLWGPSTMEVLSWYEAEGLSWDRDRQGQNGSRILAPDHAGIEMAFLSVISDRPAANRLEGDRAGRLRGMLAHLAKWLPLFKNAVEERDGNFAVDDGMAGWTGLAIEVVAADVRRRS